MEVDIHSTVYIIFLIFSLLSINKFFKGAGMEDIFAQMFGGMGGMGGGRGGFGGGGMPGGFSFRSSRGGGGFPF